MSARSLSLIVFAAIAVACGGIGAASSFDSVGGGSSGGADTVPGSGDASSGPPASSALASPDAGPVDASPAFTYIGNPLCKARFGGACNPELSNTPPIHADAETNSDQTADNQCRTLLAAEPDSGSFACHVIATDAGATPTCLPEGDSKESCIAQQSCTAGNECVGGQTGDCRRYCCDPSACDPSTFCDVQPIVASAGVMVPVCMPITQCELLGGNSCPGQTCGIVDQAKGLTSCLDIGPRAEGDECETDHCAKDLACLGTAGSRKCFKLCDVNGGSHECAMGEMCLSNSVTFKGADVGICGQ